ncbi:Pr6Pr family membrane protein [Mycoplasmatota bacterium WC30]
MKRKFALIIVILATVGVLATIISTALENPETPVISSILTLRYFTIQSNFIVIIYFWWLFSGKFKQNKQFTQLFGGVVVYITITFMVFAIVLQKTWNPDGIGLIGNVLNHYVTPIGTLIFLGLFRKDYQFTFSDIKTWLIYPIVYLIILVLQGLISGDYIYPFFQIDEIGVLPFIYGILGIIVLFMGLSIAAVFVTPNQSTKT